MSKGFVAELSGSPRFHPLEQLLAYIVSAATLCLPLLYSAGSDGFRLPKELALRAEAILIVAALLTGFLLWGRTAFASIHLPQPLLLLVGALCVWAVLTTLVSTNRQLSSSALVYASAALFVFIGTYIAAGRRTVNWLLLPIAVASTVNSILAVIQATGIAEPLRLDPRLPLHLRTTGLIGNPNDVGTYLMPVTLLMVCAALSTRRAIWWLVAATTAIGLVASGALTAMIAMVAALAALALRLGRKGWIGLAAIVLAAVTVVVINTPLRQRMASMRQAFEAADYPALTSYRIYSIATAWEMFKDHPLTGVGPGAFKFHYLSYRKAFDEQHPQWYLRLRAAENYGEAHCDHVQILAEEGLPGWILFVAALTVVAKTSFSRSLKDDHDIRTRFVLLSAFPMAVGLGVLAIAAFPLELAVSTQLLVCGAATMLRWNTEA